MNVERNKHEVLFELRHLNFYIFSFEHYDVGGDTLFSQKRGFLTRSPSNKFVLRR